LREFVVARPGTTFAALLLGIIAVAVAFAPLIAPHDPYDLASFDILDAELPPVWLEGSDPRFLLGTDAQGRDLFSAILYGARISLIVGVLAVAIQAAIGIPLGLFAGYVGGRLDGLISRLGDIQLSLSTLMMAIIAMALFRAGLGGESLSRYAVPLLVVVIGLAEWPFFARTARAATQVEAAKDYVRAGRALGASDFGILFRHILPNITSPLIVIATTQVAGAIMAEAALSFLGLGMPVTKPSLGTLIRSGYDLMFAGAWWVTVLPGLVLILVLVSVNALGDGLRDALDPKLRALRVRNGGSEPFPPP
jgi:peptide/nickel transport system permease protein